MKKIALIAVMAFLTALCHAQKIQLKKGILSKDDVPLGKLEGKATLLNGTDVSIKSMEGSAWLNIKDPLVTFGSPFDEPIRYYAVHFVSLNKMAALVPNDKKFFTSEKKLMEYMFENIGADFLNKDGLNEQVVDKFLAEKDQSKKINDDTIHIAKLVKVGKEKLKDHLLARPGNGELKIKSLHKETTNAIWNETLQTFEIKKGDVVIGKMTKFYHGDPSITTGTGSQSKSVRYIVQRRVNPFMLDDRNIEFIDLARVKSTDSGPDVYTNCNVGMQSFKPSDIYAAEFDIVTWLISKGCL